MLRQILLAYDGSPGSEKARLLSLELAQALGVGLHVLAVIDNSARKGVDVEADRRGDLQMLRNLEAIASKQGLPVQLEVAVGHPADEISKRGV